MGELEHVEDVCLSARTVPWPWNGPALYVTEHCTGKRRKGRKTKGIRASPTGRRIIGGMRTTAQGPEVREEGESFFAVSPSIRYVLSSSD